MTQPQSTYTRQKSRAIHWLLHNKKKLGLTVHTAEHIIGVEDEHGRHIVTVWPKPEEQSWPASDKDLENHYQLVNSGIRPTEVRSYKEFRDLMDGWLKQ